MSNQDTLELLDELKEYQSQYLKLQAELKKYENMINLTKNKIYNSCEHIWSIDHTLCDDHTVYICNKCSLVR